jgi:hypothetical protein
MALQVYDKPDDRENETAIHTFSATMCWAGCDRLGLCLFVFICIISYQ